MKDKRPTTNIMGIEFYGKYDIQEELCIMEALYAILYGLDKTKYDFLK